MTEVNLRTRLHAIIRAAGLEPWPKAFVALRSTRATELRKQHPDYVVNAWIGHSQRVAERHYLQVTDDDFERASAPDDANECTNSVHVRRPDKDSNAVPSRTMSQTSKNLRRGTTRSSKDGRDRTRICDLLHVKQAL